jgi:hypothetical protein
MIVKKEINRHIMQDSVQQPFQIRWYDANPIYRCMHDVAGFITAGHLNGFKAY